MAQAKRISDGIPVVPLQEEPLSVEELIEALSKRVSSEVSSKIRTDEEPRAKTFLGSDAKNWGGWLLKAVVAAAMGIFAWYNFVNDSINDRPTFEEAKAIHASESKIHEQHGVHPATAKKDEEQDRQIKVMSDILIRTTTIMETMSIDISDIKEDLKDGLRRRRRR